MQEYSLNSNACKLTALLTVGTNGENSKTAPIKIVARTTSAVPSGVKEIGNIVHDFAGMKVEQSRIPLDYGHDEKYVIGYANHIELAGDELHASGALVPYAADPTDKATEIIYKAQNGVPYQASIYTGTDIIAEKIPAGKSTLVNGVSVDGPVTVFREWTLRGIAVLPYGRDSHTSSSIALSNTENVTVSVTEQPEAAEVKAVDAVPVEDKEVAEAEAVEAAEVVEDVAQPEAAPVEATTLSEGKKFLTAFGAQGGVWFAEGKSFEEANELFTLSLKAENESLKAKLQEAAAKLSASRGEETPVTGLVPATDPKADAITKLSQNLTKGLAKFAAGIQIRK